MTYRGSYKFHRPKGIHKSEMFDKIATGVKRKVELRKRKGLFGVKNSFQNDNIIKWIEEVGRDHKDKFIQVSDRNHKHYSWYLYDVAYIEIWNKRIRKVDNIALEEYEKNCSTCRFAKKSKGILFCRKSKKETTGEEICDKFRNKPLNEHYMPEIIYLDAIGWIITENEKNIDDYKEQRHSKLKGQTNILTKRCEDATRFLQQIKEHQPSKLLPNYDKDKDVV